jgi:phage-related protein
MAIVGDAYVVVRAITSGVEKDIQNSFRGIDRVAEKAGKQISNGVNKGFSISGFKSSIFPPKFAAEAAAAKDAYASFTRAGYAAIPAITALAGIIGTLGTGLISLVSIIGGAAIPTLAALGGIFTSVAQAGGVLKLAFSGVLKAVQAGTKASRKSVSNTRAERDAQRNLAKAYEDLAIAQKDVNLARQTAIEQMQQLGFDSEDAAISEQKAALELEKARETLARVSDLPPNSRARKEAQLAFAEADLNYRRAIDKNNDLKKAEALNATLGPDVATQVENSKVVVDAKRSELEAERNLIKATEARDLAAGGSEADAYADALSNLSKEAQHFVKYLVSIKDEFTKLRDAAGQKLFPQLETAIGNLVTNLFPALKPLITETGNILGKVAIRISEVITSSENIRRLESIWKTNNKYIDSLGTAVANLYEIFLILINAAKPLIDAFGEYLKNVTGSWKETLKLDEATGKLADRFSIAQGILKDLGTILGNVFGGFKNLVKANVGPGSGGQLFLEYFKKISLAFKNLQTIDGKPLKEFFAKAAENGVKLLGLLGDIIGGFIRLADNKGLGIFLGQLRIVNSIFSDIGENVDASLPSLGNFLIEFSKTIKIFTSSNSIQIFFDILTGVLKTFNNIVQTPIGKFFLMVSAVLHPVLLAFGSLVKIGGIIGRVLVGMGLSALKFVTFLKDIVFYAPALKALALQFAAPILVIAAIATVLTLAYQKSELFRNAISNLVSVVGGALTSAFDKINSAINSVAPNIGGIMGVFKTLGDFIGKYIVPLFSVILVAAINQVATVISSVIKVVGFLINAFGGVASAVGKAFTTVISVVKSAINILISVWNNTLGKLKITLPKIGSFGGGTIGFPTIPTLAKGGTVMPSAGGTLAQIGEAGRAERVEPLDPNGLSKRDKAMIETLAGGKGSGINITINPSAGMDERELASIVSRQIAFQLRKGAA